LEKIGVLNISSTVSQQN